jgi:hypothetical protein
MERRGIHVGYWLEAQKEKGHWDDENLGEWIIKTNSVA